MLFEFFFGYFATKAFDKLQGHLFSNNIFKRLDTTISSWADELPNDCYLDSTALSLKNTFRPENSELQKELIKNLNDRIIPSRTLWVSLIEERRNFIKNYGHEELQPFFSVSDYKVKEYVDILAEKLYSTCAIDEQIFRNNATKRLDEIKSILEKVEIRPIVQKSEHVCLQTSSFHVPLESWQDYTMLILGNALRRTYEKEERYKSFCSFLKINKQSKSVRVTIYSHERRFCFHLREIANELKADSKFHFEQLSKFFVEKWHVKHQLHKETAGLLLFEFIFDKDSREIKLESKENNQVPSINENMTINDGYMLLNSFIKSNNGWMHVHMDSFHLGAFKMYAAVTATKSLILGNFKYDIHKKDNWDYDFPIEIL